MSSGRFSSSAVTSVASALKTRPLRVSRTLASGANRICRRVEVATRFVSAAREQADLFCQRITGYFAARRRTKRRRHAQHEPRQARPPAARTRADLPRAQEDRVLARVLRPHRDLILFLGEPGHRVQEEVPVALQVQELASWRGSTCRRPRAASFLGGTTATLSGPFGSEDPAWRSHASRACASGLAPGFRARARERGGRDAAGAGFATSSERVMGNSGVMRARSRVIACD